MTRWLADLCAAADDVRRERERVKLAAAERERTRPTRMTDEAVALVWHTIGFGMYTVTWQDGSMTPALHVDYGRDERTVIWPEPGAHIMHPDGRHQFVPYTRAASFITGDGDAYRHVVGPHVAASYPTRCARCQGMDGEHEHWCVCLSEVGDCITPTCDRCRGAGCSACTDDDGLPL